MNFSKKDALYDFILAEAGEISLRNLQNALERVLHLGVPQIENRFEHLLAKQINEIARETGMSVVVDYRKLIGEYVKTRPRSFDFGPMHVYEINEAYLRECIEGIVNESLGQEFYEYVLKKLILIRDILDVQREAHFHYIS